ncbi:putative NAD-specific glutamate dehydrogenase encoded in antisense gene pair with dnaKJ [Salipiger bermudensis HTCC2601]|uniref:Putative NAD-specific glutamate dehydrogenase encoded in antisense gene pair with dnaKJ n=1 Tax=Salipiger bermudensis (strain DSM 26914 / JCM 13377 / KCTC 12554 / HTCC2601) TaxID=314265 RepID=Q0FVM5_SALBH|nr:putative NAD-specific glutamate dehydrogenase encoded in antisense gene pair with dnaKJ [Salipiger bermudensis HTCC2601]
MDAGLDLVGLHVVLLEVFLQRGNGQLDRFDGRRIDLVAVLFHRLLGRVDEALGLVAGLDELATLLVLLGVLFGFLDHLFDVLVRKATGGLDGDLLLFVRALVLGGHGDDAVGVDVEGHLDLRQAARCRRDLLEIELAEQLVVCCHLALTLEDADRHGRLVVLGGGEDLRLLGRDRGVAVDQAGEHATQRLDAQRQRGHVEQDHVLHVPLQNTGLNGGAHGDNLVRVHALVRLLAEELGHLFDDLRHPGLTADQNDLVDLVLGQASVLEGRLAGLDRVLDQVADEAFQLGAGQLHDHVQRLAARAHRDERLVDLGLGRARELDLGLFSSFLETLQGHLVLGQVDLVLFLELVRQVVDDPHVEVFTAEERVAVGRLHLEQAIVDLEDGDVEGAAAEVIHGDGLGLFLVETIGQRGRGRLVDDAQDFETGNLAGVLGGLTLGVVEIGRHGDDRLGHLFAEIAFGGFLHLAEDEGGNLRRRILFALGFHPRVAIAAVNDLVGHDALILGHLGVGGATADQALDGKDGGFGVGDGLALCGLADEAFIVGKCDDGGGGAGAFGVFDHARLAAVHDGDAGVRGAEVDTDNFTHTSIPFQFKAMTRGVGPDYGIQPR